MKVYIAGPMSGYPEFNFPSFEAAILEVEELGNEPVSPHLILPDHEGECRGVDLYRKGAEGHMETCHLKADIEQLIKCDAIYLLRGWPASIGARLELSIACHLGLTVFYQDPV